MICFLLGMKEGSSWKINTNITKNILINYLRKLHGIVVAKLSSDFSVSIAGNCFTICLSLLSSSSVSTSPPLSVKQHLYLYFAIICILPYYYVIYVEFNFASNASTLDKRFLQHCQRGATNRA